MATPTQLANFHKAAKTLSDARTQWQMLDMWTEAAFPALRRAKHDMSAQYLIGPSIRLRGVGDESFRTCAFRMAAMHNFKAHMVREGLPDQDQEDAEHVFKWVKSISRMLDAHRALLNAQSTMGTFVNPDTMHLLHNAVVTATTKRRSVTGVLSVGRSKKVVTVREARLWNVIDPQENPHKSTLDDLWITFGEQGVDPQLLLKSEEVKFTLDTTSFRVHMLSHEAEARWEWMNTLIRLIEEQRLALKPEQEKAEAWLAANGRSLLDTHKDVTRSVNSFMNELTSDVAKTKGTVLVRGFNTHARMGRAIVDALVDAHGLPANARSLAVEARWKDMGFTLSDAQQEALATIPDILDRGPADYALPQWRERVKAAGLSQNR